MLTIDATDRMVLDALHGSLCIKGIGRGGNQAGLIEG